MFPAGGKIDRNPGLPPNKLNNYERLKRETGYFSRRWRNRRKMSGVVTATILGEGKEIDPERILIRVDVLKEVNRIPTARIVMLDGDAAKQTFELSNDDFFEPGKEIELKLRREGEKDATVFKGIVVKHAVMSEKSGSFLTVDLKDASIKLTAQRKNTVFSDMKDSDIMAKIIKDAGLKAASVANTAPTHARMVQYYCTDWDFILSRADVNGLWVLADDGEISIFGPDLSGSPAHTFEYGKDDIYAFEMEADIQGLCQSISGSSWDVKTGEMSAPKKAKAFPVKQGNLDPAKLAKTIGGGACELIAASLESEEEMQAWADARMIKERVSMLRGRLTIPGAAHIKPGDVAEIAGIGERFNGTVLVTAIRHQVSERGWQTDAQFGLKGGWFSQNDAIVDVPAAGLVPAVNGLQVGVVQEFEKDPDKRFRVKVNMPAVDEKEGVVWARLASVDAGAARGVFFRPEPGDEVVVGFFNDDPRQPVILGSMHGGKNEPPLEIADPNNEKGIVTKGELKVLFNDEDKSIEISTPSGARVSIKDEEGIFLEDKSGNKLTMDDKGVTITSAKDILLEGKNITIKGDSVDVN